MKNINFGAYPTMITPYNEDRTVDWGAVKALTEWYWRKGCDGIFAACQSSEIQFLSLNDRVRLARTVSDTAKDLASRDKSRAPMSVVASGHISDDPADQIRELSSIADTGADAVVLITNRMDIENTGDAAWISDTEKLIAHLPSETLLGVYECPRPYKRLLTPEMLRWAASTGRFGFIKDTCCDADEMRRRLSILAGSGVGLYNANGQTALETLRAGACGYCGIMCNFHPDLYVWLCHHYADAPELADRVHAILSMCAFTEGPTYPVTAKYYLSEYENLPMSLYARSSDRRLLTPYWKECVKQMKLAADVARELIGE